jgi:hypothetical protein
VTQDAHAPVRIAALDFEHLRELEFREARVREVERDRDARDAVGREPFVRQPDVRPEVQVARAELATELIDAMREIGTFDLQIQLPELQVEQLVIAERRNLVGPDLPARRARHGG